MNENHFSFMWGQSQAHETTLRGFAQYAITATCKNRMETPVISDIRICYIEC